MFVCVDLKVSRRKKHEGGFSIPFIPNNLWRYHKPISFVYFTSRGVRLALGKGNELGIGVTFTGTNTPY